ncbi:TPA: hypothetical protein DCR79_02335 [Patescibacteria group bacterium]|uniref:Uncharacterized protein n=1 Tax=Candidatus Woesebacteria bacterium GW2011_GWB1_39_10b TaxID=1618573 RepID=A0A0G0LPX9_9BACT|nr:MAG: hypothetical protein UT19_C0019G0003 [Candidatus Woesebacteria bacterium GW2011_GWB1_39_10b]HAR55100.1 hypothetical protein [Patescibacteria group bacterium]HCR42131.1 hypothetical protein [Patescibacteria group bacterium]
MLHNNFAVRFVPQSQSGVDYRSAGVLIGLAVLFVVLSAIASIPVQSAKTMTKTYPAVSVAEAYFTANLQ